MSRRSLRRHLTYANVMATIAVVVAVGGGTAYAVVAARDSVVSSSVRDGAIQSRDLAPESVNGGKVLNDSLTGDDIDERLLEDVPAASSITRAMRVVGKTTEVLPNEVKIAYAQCPFTWTATAGGYVAWSVDSNGARIVNPTLYVGASDNADRPQDEDHPQGFPLTRWRIQVYNWGTVTGYFQPSAVCVPRVLRLK